MPTITKGKSDVDTENRVARNKFDFDEPCFNGKSHSYGLENFLNLTSNVTKFYIYTPPSLTPYSLLYIMLLYCLTTI